MFGKLLYAMGCSGTKSGCGSHTRVCTRHLRYIPWYAQSTRVHPEYIYASLTKHILGRFSRKFFADTLRVLTPLLVLVVIVRNVSWTFPYRVCGEMVSVTGGGGGQHVL